VRLYLRLAKPEGAAAGVMEAPTYATGIYAQVFAVMGILPGTILAINSKEATIAESIIRMDSINQKTFLGTIHRILFTKGDQHGKEQEEG